MESVLERVHGKVFSYSDSNTKKKLRLVCHSAALDIDVFTGLSVFINDAVIENLEFAKSVKINKMLINHLHRTNGNTEDEYSRWIYSPKEFATVRHVSLRGFVQCKWIFDCLAKFDNLKSLFVEGAALQSRILPNSKKPIYFRTLEILEIITSQSYELVAERAESLSDSDNVESGDRKQLLGVQRSLGKKNLKTFDIEKGREDCTPVADNIYYLLYTISSPRLHTLRVTFDQDLHNLSSLNWKDRPLKKFIRRHAKTLRYLTLDGEQNVQENIPRPKLELLNLPSNLHHIFVSIVDHSSMLPDKVGLPFFKRQDHTSLWKELLRNQAQLESLHCTIEATWAWHRLKKVIRKNCLFLQIINIGCSWLDVDTPMNMDLISQCAFLKKFTFSVSAITSPVDIEEKTRCRVENLTSLLTCVFLETIFINGALCETNDLDMFTHLPNLTCLVLMYVGKLTRFGVTVGVLQDFLAMPTLNLLLVVEFHRQKQSLEAYRLKGIIRSEINNRHCPIVQQFAPLSGFGKFVYVGDITELTESSQPDSYRS